MTERNGIASANWLPPAAGKPLDESATGSSCPPESIPPGALLEQVLERTNLQRALKQVCQNKGAPGIDGMTVEELPGFLKHHWPELRSQLETGRYRPQPVKRVHIPKGEGKTRPLGIPTVVDRFIQQAIAQIISAQWESHFHDHSYGFVRLRHIPRCALDQPSAVLRPLGLSFQPLGSPSCATDANHRTGRIRLGCGYGSGKFF